MPRHGMIERNLLSFDLEAANHKEYCCDRRMHSSSWQRSLFYFILRTSPVLIWMDDVSRLLDFEALDLNIDSYWHWIFPSSINESLILICTFAGAVMICYVSTQYHYSKNIWLHHDSGFESWNFIVVLDRTSFPALVWPCFARNLQASSFLFETGAVSSASVCGCTNQLFNNVCTVSAYQ